MNADRGVSRRAWLGGVAAASLVGTSVAQEKAAKPTQEELEKQFSDKMTGAVLVGHYSVVGKNAKPANPERYELKKVAKFGGELWIFEYKYGQKDVTIPLTLRMIWAEDTPMITLTNATLPGLGAAFGARVIFQGDLYAGTWSHGNVGGHLWGTIEKAAVANDEQK
jgi:hypothetical protein